MDVKINGCRVTVSRTKADQRAKSESEFWYRLRNEFRKRQSMAWVKVRQPGALTSMPYGLREGPNRRVNNMVVDCNYALRCLAIAFNQFKEVELQLLAVEMMS